MNGPMAFTDRKALEQHFLMVPEESIYFLNFSQKP
jgi:hypothetical protein